MVADGDAFVEEVVDGVVVAYGTQDAMCEDGVEVVGECVSVGGSGVGVLTGESQEED